MVDKTREIYTKLDNIDELAKLIAEIRVEEKRIRQLFLDYDKLCIEENKVFDNWSNMLDEILSRLDHATL